MSKNLLKKEKEALEDILKSIDNLQTNEAFNETKKQADLEDAEFEKRLEDIRNRNNTTEIQNKNAETDLEKKPVPNQKSSL